nr:hypothetical protein [Tanacetum cinerariifolium]
MSSLESHSTVTYTSISSNSNLPPWGFHLLYDTKAQLPEIASQSLEQAPPSSDYVHGLEYLKYLATFDDKIPVEHQLRPADALPTTLSLGYVADSDLEEDPEEDLTKYPTDGRDDDEEVSSNDDDEEDEEHLAPTNSAALPAIDHPPMVASTEALIAEYASAPTPSSPPLSSLSLWPSPLPKIPSPPLHVPSPPLFLTSADRKSDIPTANMPFQKRLCLTALALSIRDVEERAPTTLEEIDERVTNLVTNLRKETEEMYVQHNDARDNQAILRAQIHMLCKDRRYFSSMSFDFEREAMYASKAWSRSEDSRTNLEALIRVQEARVTALEAQIMTLRTHHDRMKWQRHDEGDMVTSAFGRIHALEARDLSHHNGVEDTRSKNGFKENHHPMTDAAIKGLIAQGITLWLSMKQPETVEMEMTTMIWELAEG